ncbi:F-box domain [Fusarium oxysporum f. sp. vasinfectum]|nr:F-box domain [Fusarium oxysporum f. sp. vasinfectum]
MATHCNVLQQFTRTEESEFKGMIRYVPNRNRLLPSTTSISNQPRLLASSLGQLDCLPAELLLSVLDLLDFQSLSRLSRVSLLGKDVIEDLPVYWETVQHAPEALAVLGQTHLLSYHPATLLHSALRQSRCVSCLAFGGVLFLPTCERVCFECLYENQALRMTSPAMAKECFSLTDHDLQRIPVMHSVPGTFGLRFQFVHKQTERLVSVKQAKELALEIHGSAEKLTRLRPTYRPGRTSMKDAAIFRHFHEAPLDPPGCDLSRLPRKAEVVEDDFGGMASIRFPSLSDAGTDKGVLCQGCLVTYSHYMQGVLPQSTLSELVPVDVGPYPPLLALLTRLWSTEGFAEHAHQCYGVRRILGQ